MEKERKRGAIKVFILQPTERRFSDSLVFAITDTVNTPQMPGSSLLKIPKSPNIYKTRVDLNFAHEIIGARMCVCEDSHPSYNTFVFNGLLKSPPSTIGNFLIPFSESKVSLDFSLKEKFLICLFMCGRYMNIKQYILN